ncbi:Pre-mRNA-splicing_factor ATP-dependent RNA helicase [Hexamita inflata]|uniref:Pre-mRNA-splicing_factor ATP-dependent RNA helicase n=1 Tax=Hexamita inflata TaxID=28002 RepID=A0ABP1K2M5_9EUKA
MRNSFLIKENEPDLNVIAQSLIVLRPNNNLAEQKHLDLHQTTYMINTWKVNDDYCFQIKTCLLDIVKILVIEGKHEEISQMLGKRIKSIIDHAHSVTIKYQHQSVQELKRILMFLNSFINALNNKENNVIEVRMFCFGNTTLPLPVYQLRNRFLNKGSSFLVIQSSTGSGKTMLIPIFMLNQLRNNKNIRIIITQPTSITVKQIANTIKEKIIGNEFSVGTNIQQQYDICVCTPMQVLKMIQLQKQDMQQYIYSNTIFILDEFHTRTVSLDVLFAQLKQNFKYFNLPYQFIMMSATPDLQIISLLPEKDEQKLIMKIENCSPFNITQIRIKANSVKEAVATVPAKQAVDFIHEMVTKQKPNGNILCFTSGKMECEDICEQTIQGLKDNKNVVCVDFTQFKNMNVYAVHEELRKISDRSNKLVVVPIVMAGQATELEKTIASDPIPEDFSHKCIKVIAATNIAETSITIEDLVCLIDSGMFKEASWDDKKGIRILKEKQISAAQRTQRVGRVGRVRDGFAYLIDVDSSQKVEQQKPEISRIDLKQTILELRDIQINLEDINNSLPTQPDSDQLKYNLETLQKVQALDQNYQITELGTKLAQYQDINPLAGIIFEKLLKYNGQLYLLISIFAYFLSQTHNFIQNCKSDIAKDCFTEESDIATMIKCVIAIEEIEEDKQRQQFCVQQEVQFSVFQKVRSQTENVFGLILKANNVQYNIPGQLTLQNDVFHQLIKQIDSSLLLSVLDEYVKLINEQQLYLYQNNQNCAQFDIISNINVKPRYIYLSNSKGKQIICFERQGCRNAISYSNVYFFDIEFNETHDIYVGNYMHRLQNSYQSTHCVNISLNSFKLPYTKWLFNIYFNNNPYIRQMQQRIKRNNEQLEYFGEGMDNESIFYSNSKELPKNEIQNIYEQIQKLIQLSFNSPTSLISRLNKNKYVEFQQNQQILEVKQFQQTLTPYAYSINQKSIQTLLNNKIQFRISFVFDLRMDDSAKFNLFNFKNKKTVQETVIYFQNNQITNNLIIVTDKNINNLQPLQWFDPQSNEYYSQHIDDQRYKIMTENPIKGITLQHNENEILMQQEDSQLFSVVLEKNQYLELFDKFIVIDKNLEQDQDFQHHKEIDYDIKKAKKEQNNNIETIEQLNNLQRDFNQTSVMNQILDEYESIKQQLLLDLKMKHKHLFQNGNIKIKQLFENAIMELQNNNDIQVQHLCSINSNNSNINKNIYRYMKNLFDDQIQKVYFKQEQGLYSLQIPMNHFSKFEDRDADGNPQIIERQAVKLNNYCYNYIVTFNVFNNLNNDLFRNQIVSIIHQFGMFISYYKCDPKIIERNLVEKFTIKVRTTEAAFHVLQALKLIVQPQLTKIPLNIISSDLQRNQTIINFLNEHINQQGYNISVNEQCQLSGNQEQIQQFLKYINTLELPVKELRFHNIPNNEIHNLIKPFMDKGAKFNYNNNKIIVPNEYYERVQEIIQKRISQIDDKIFSQNLCGKCQTSKTTITTGNNQCSYFCEQCAIIQLKQQLHQNDLNQEIYIQTGDGDENIGKFVSYFIESDELREIALKILQNAIKKLE